MEDKKFKLSRSSKSNLKGVNKSIIKLVERVILKTKHDFGIPRDGGFRTAQEQNNLFYKRPSVTTLDGFRKKSYHQSGMAFDIFLYDEHKACWAKDCQYKYKEISDLFKEEFDLMKEEGIFKENQFLGWGGDWIRFKDTPHFEVREK